MARPKTLDEFLLILDTLNKKGSESLDECKSCGDKYGSGLRELTESHCPACAEEIFYDSTSLATREILRRNPSEGLGSPAPTVPHSDSSFHGGYVD